MKLDITISLSSNRYNVQLDVLELSANEEEKMSQFGEPLINVGGSFSGSVKRTDDTPPVEVEFVLPEQHRRMKSDFPVRRSFSIDDDTDSDIKAKLYADTIEQRLKDARDELLERSATLVSSVIKTV